MITGNCGYLKEMMIDNDLKTDQILEHYFVFLRKIVGNRGCLSINYEIRLCSTMSKGFGRENHIFVPQINSFEIKP